MRCQECRRLATALRPAVELFQESIEPDQTTDLPGYRGRVAMPGADGRTRALRRADE